MENLEDKVLNTKKTIDELRLQGVNDYDIMKILSLKPKPLGVKTYQIFKLIRAGKLDLNDSMELNAQKVGLKSGKSAFKYHLDKLVEYGYIIR